MFYICLSTSQKFLMSTALSILCEKYLCNQFPLNKSRKFVIISTFINDFTVLVVQEWCLKNIQSLKSQAFKGQLHCFDLNNDKNHQKKNCLLTASLRYLSLTTWLYILCVFLELCNSSPFLLLNVQNTMTDQSITYIK